MMTRRNTPLPAPGIPPEGRQPHKTILGPFEFDLSVQFIAGRAADVNETVTADGAALTLERVVTPSETRATIRWGATAGLPSNQWAAEGYAINLAVDGWEMQQQTQWNNPMWRRPGAEVYPLPFALFDKRARGR